MLYFTIHLYNTIKSTEDNFLHQILIQKMDFLYFLNDCRNNVLKEVYRIPFVNPLTPMLSLTLQLHFNIVPWVSPLHQPRSSTPSNDKL